MRISGRGGYSRRRVTQQTDQITKRSQGRERNRGINDMVNEKLPADCKHEIFSFVTEEERQEFIGELRAKFPSTPFATAVDPIESYPDRFLVAVRLDPITDERDMVDHATGIGDR